MSEHVCLPTPACHHRGEPVVNTMISASRFVYIKTPIRYTRSPLRIPEYTQTNPRVCGT